MSSCVATANPDDIIMIPVLFITLLLFQYLTPKAQILTIFESFAFKSIFG